MLGMASMPLGILQALHHKPVALPKLKATTLSKGVTLGNDLLVELSIGREGDIFLLYRRVYEQFLVFSWLCKFLDPTYWAVAFFPILLGEDLGENLLICRIIDRNFLSWGLTILLLPIPWRHQNWTIKNCTTCFLYKWRLGSRITFWKQLRSKRNTSLNSY